jgi:ribosomal protein S13
MGKVYLLPRGVERPVPSAAPSEIGPDADDPALTLDVRRLRIRRHSGELKNLVRNQEFVAGIGNAYSDEILHAARLLPSRWRATLAPEEVDELHEAMRSTLMRAVATLRERVPPTFETEVRDFLAVHNKGGEPCPRCGQRITQIEAGGFTTSYCRHCQHRSRNDRPRAEPANANAIADDAKRWRPKGSGRKASARASRSGATPALNAKRAPADRLPDRHKAR